MLYAIRFLAVHGWDTHHSRRRFLVTTGVEALYADLGHFGRKPIALAWYSIVFPSLLLELLGRGSRAASPTAQQIRSFTWFCLDALTTDRLGHSRRRDRLAGAHLEGIFPDHAVRPDGLYTLYQHAAPRARRAWTGLCSSNQYSFAVGCIALVLAFRSSDASPARWHRRSHLTMIATTLPLYKRGVSEVECASRGCGVRSFLGIELAFLAANSTKIVEGGWVPLAIGGIVFVMMTTWKKRTTPAAHELPRDSVATRIRRLYISTRPTFGRAGTRSRHGGLSCGTAARHSRTSPA